MAGLRLFTGNRLEILADKLALLLSAPLSSPLAGEVIIVQSRGMERWLAMEIARRLGVCANIRFPFPKAFVQEAFAAVLGDATANGAFTPEVMTWKIMKILPSFLLHPGFTQIRRYLGEEIPAAPLSPIEGGNVYGLPEGENNFPRSGDLLKRFQLSERIAYLFDQYLIFRPGMITAWEKGRLGERDEAWQSELWRALVAGGGNQHPAALKDAFLRKIADRGVSASALPERISLFGISALPRFYLEIFHALAQQTEVNLFLMNPSREFWGDIRSDKESTRELARLRERGKDYGPSGEGLYLERGNSLLSSLGTAGREFFSLIWDFPGEEAEFFSEPGEESLLTCIQSDILNLRDRGGEERKIVAPGDRSIRFHSCHSPMREIEALYDYLLSLFEEDRELLPGDILVMAPDIEVYAPLIKALFAMPEDATGNSRRRYIPFSIADRDSRAESAVIEGFMQMLDMAGGRFEAGQVLSLLEIPEIGGKFGFTLADWELVCRWVTETGIRWGLDGNDRRRLGLPALEENTWREGQSRMLAGYAMPGREGRLIKGILPYDLEGSETAVLGKFLTYTEKLFSHVTSLGRRRSLTEWSRTLEDMLTDLFAPQEDGEREIKPLRDALRRLETLAEASDFKEPLDISVIKSYLNRLFKESGFGYGFLSGGVTFCSMLPMRSIPCKVICLLGMNGTAYPRKSWEAGFDLLLAHPQPGDRSRRKDDRYLFLEALLSARKRLLISYVGQSSADNSLMPPSILVSELLDYLKEGFSLPEGSSIAERLVTLHRLQAFSPAYFQGKGGLFSYSAENWRAAKRLVEKKALPPFSVPRLPAPDDEGRNVDIADLAAFFADPVRYFLRRRLGINFAKMPIFPAEGEPFELYGLDRYALGQTMTERGLAGEDLRDCPAAARASGRLPHGAVGVYYCKGLIKEVQSFVERVKSFRKGSVAAPHEVDLDLAGFRIKGELPLHDGLLMNWRCAALKPRDHLRLWIFHLALHALDKDRQPSSPSVLIGRSETWCYSPLPSGDACKLLASLLEMYWEGLSRPLKFFPLSSWKYGEDVFAGGKSVEEGLRAATVLWEGNEYQAGEKNNPGYPLCFTDSEAVDEEFHMTAEAILAGLFACRKEMTDDDI